MSDLQKRSIRITDLTRVDTSTKIDSKQELLLPVASNASEKDTFAMPLNSFVEWLLLKHAADKDLSNLSDIGQAILDAKQDYFNLINDDADFDTFTNDGIYKVNVTGTIEVHAPTDATGFYVVSTDTDNSGVIEQQARNLYINSGNIYHRQRVNGTWSNWGLITQDMSAPTFVDAPTVVNPGTNDDQLATIGQLNGKFSDIFKTEYHITEGTVVSGNIDYIDGSVRVNAGTKYITNDSNVIETTEAKTLPIGASTPHYVFMDGDGNIRSWDSFEKVMEIPSETVEGTLYYNILSDQYYDGTSFLSLAPIGKTSAGSWSSAQNIEFMNLGNLSTALNSLDVQNKVAQRIGDDTINSTVSSENEYNRQMMTGHYTEGAEGEFEMDFGAGVDVTSYEENDEGEYDKSVKTRLFALDGENSTEIVMTPTSAILNTPRLDEASEIATLADIEEIKQTSLTFIGYVSSTEPSGTDYSFNRGNLWIVGNEMPETLPVPASDVKVWDGTAWVAYTESYTPKDFDFFRNINDNEGYYWFGGAWKIMSTDMDTSYFVLGDDGKWKIKDNVNLPGAPTTSTPAISDDSTKIATTAFVQSVASTKQNTLTPGTGIEITEEGVINNTQTSAEWGKITGPIEDQTDLMAAINNAGTPDNISITKTTDNKLQAIGTLNKNTAATAIKGLYDWVGTLEEYNQQQVKTLHPEWVAFITDDVAGGESVYTKSEINMMMSNITSTIFGSIYPVGSLYFGEQEVCPMQSVITGSVWEKVSVGRVLQGADSEHTVGTTIEAGLPNIAGYYNVVTNSSGLWSAGGAFYQGDRVGVGSSDSSTTASRLQFDASRSSSVYGGSNTVQPAAYVVNIWKRTA